MYSILVVEDEIMICKGIKHLIDELKNPNIEEVYTAFSGEEAELMFNEKNMDIVITDICMPGMNGLELIEKIKFKNSSIKIIVLSGYNEFEYAKAAFKYGVEDYLLKPARISKLKEVLEGVIENITNTEKSEKEIEKNNFLNRELAVENNLYKIFTNNRLGEEKIKSIFGELTKTFPKRFFYVIMTRFSDSNFVNLNNNSLLEMMEKLNYEIFNPEKVITFNIIGFNNCILCILNTSETLSKEDIMGYCLIFLEHLKNLQYTHFCIGLSSEGKGIESLISLNKQCETAFSYKLLYGCYSIIEYNLLEINKKEISISSNEFREFGKWIKENEQTKINAFLDRIFSRHFLVGFKIESIQKLYDEICELIDKALYSNDRVEYLSEYIKLEEFESLKDVCFYLKNTVYKVQQSLRLIHNDRNTINIALNYIRENFQKDIDMKSVANIVYMNYSYFSRWFKGQTGKNFYDYLTEVRMEEAKRMLDVVGTKIYEVSIMVGYDNPKRFTRLFKGYFGVSPEDYRKKVREVNSSERKQKNISLNIVK